MTTDGCAVPLLLLLLAYDALQTICAAALRVRTATCRATAFGALPLPHRV